VAPLSRLGYTAATLGPPTVARHNAWYFRRFLVSDRRPLLGSMLLAAGLLVLTSACGTEPAATLPDLQVSDGSAIDVPKDASATDALAGTDAASPDAAEDIAQDTGKDTGPSKEQLCAGYVAQYAKELTAIRACQVDSECNTQTPDKLDCACGVFANAGASGWTQVQQASQQFFAHKCPTCFQATCQDDATVAYLGACQAGQCTSKPATCEAIAAAWTGLKKDAQQCAVAADCNAKLGIAVNCDACQVPASGARLAETAAQGKYAALLKTLWDSQSCGEAAPCACGPVGAVDCVAGKCQAK
jgi:hypothetical protein